jgi:hypothetical protein
MALAMRAGAGGGSHVRARAAALLGATALLAAAPAGAEPRVVEIRWVQPDGAEPTGFSAHVGPAPGSYEQEIDLGPASADPDGVRRGELVLDDASAWAVALHAYNDVGASALSNEIVVAALACAPEACEDGEACTADDCDASGCIHDPLPDGTACSGSLGDGLCVAGVCEPLQCAADGDCDDGDACNGAEACSGGSCLAGDVPDCGAPTACATPACDPAQGCIAVLAPDGWACDDGNRRTSRDRCLAGVCVGTPKSGGKSRR